MQLSAPIFSLKRKAKQHARTQGVPLHITLDQLAKREGYQSWSHLAAADATLGRAAQLAARLDVGALVLLAARPGQGKTLLGLELLAEAVKQKRHAMCFTLEYTHLQMLTLFKDHGVPASGIEIDTSDQMSAAHIERALFAAPKRSVILIDYLQLLAQRRETPDLNQQIADLKLFARQRELTFLCLSQIDRGFDPTQGALPTVDDIRLGDVMTIADFDQAIFLSDGQVKLQRLG